MRARKYISSITRYIYDSEKKLIEVIDSASYASSSNETDRAYFFYDEKGVLKTSTHYRKQYLDYKTEYSTNPLKVVKIGQNDSMILRRHTVEYDRDFYKKSTVGYYWKPTLKHISYFDGTDSSTYSYSDYKDLRKIEDFTYITNQFNSNDQLISSNISQCFMVNPTTWRTNKIRLTYNYLEGGLLKRVIGYIPYYFKYEFYN